ncbi:MAG TPA: hypothetical protein VM487_02020 [Phycisphaerae bacterium]|nr:hypothetical protein [Phycisphaerae bacterium]
MDSLTAFDLRLLEIMPVEPIGFSITELSDSLLRKRTPAAKARVRRALDHITRELGGINVHRGRDDFADYTVKMYCLRRVSMPEVRAFFARNQARNS